ncbi:hypothetical protein ACUY29_11365 [Corynebacterium aurimucosum]
MMNDESNRSFSIAEVREFMQWCEVVQTCMGKFPNSIVHSPEHQWIGRKIDEAWEKIDECLEWASIYEFELLEDSE